MSRCVLALESDQHGNCKLGLLNPNTVLHDLDEEGNHTDRRPELTAMQTYLWGLRQSHIKKVVDWAGDDDLIVLEGGDITHGDKYPSQLVSDRKGDQYIIARDNLGMWSERREIVMRLVFGTAAHNFGEGSTEMVVAELLRTQYDDLDLKVLYHGLADIRGVRVDYAHHGPSAGIRDWTRGNVARLYLRSLINSDIKEGKDPPDLVIRGHYHQYHREILEERYNGRWHQSQLLILPSYCGMDDFGRKATRSKAYQHHGMVAFEVIDGELGRMLRLVNVLDIRTKEEL